MKNTKICPKCQSTNIVRFNGFAGAYGSGNYIQTGSFSTVKIHRYICCDCGFVEEWIDKEFLDKVANSKNAIR